MKRHVNMYELEHTYNKSKSYVDLCRRSELLSYTLFLFFVSFTLDGNLLCLKQSIKWMSKSLVNYFN